MKRSTISVLVIVGLLVIDQLLKIYIKLNFRLYDTVYILDQHWAQLKFIENPGMAFGMTFGGEGGKYVLSIFRLLMAGFLIYFVRIMIRQKEVKGLIVSFSFIIAGAIGNILDSIFYGLLFSKSTPHTAAQFLPEGGGYAGFLQGKVVDMFYFPMIRTTWPDWMPLVGGNHFEFFSPIFNVADSAITIGVAIILLFYRKYFSRPNVEVKPAEPTPVKD